MNWSLSVHTFVANSVCFKEEVIHTQTSKEAEVFLLPQKIISLKEIPQSPRLKVLLSIQRAATNVRLRFLTRSLI